ncbi:Uncharacterized protein FWK35_00002877 [Aphis craccivora]|uniref:Uncharacterized protein n=2 Tax=Aphis TaxID=464929 RepID=A0A6G0Z885_APHCR|nr:Uncharacterized protein FWK35_00002877 [Aphis craccivora]
MSIINSIRRFLFRLPGKQFGYYRAIPIFVVAGASLEYLMITWRPFGIKRRRLMSGNISIATYIKFSLMAITSMMFGSQIVHNQYKPLDDLEDYVEKEMEKLKAAKELKTK